MTITRLQSVSEREVEDILLLMKELDPEIVVSPKMIQRAVESSGTFFFAAMDGKSIVGCASLCVIDSPTGKKAHIEDVVVLTSYRGQRIGRELMEFAIAFAQRELAPVDLYLTSRPHRVSANKLYQALGFRQKETNVFKMDVRNRVIV